MTIEQVAIYLRKSRQTDGLTDAESLDNHRKHLTALCEAQGWNFKIFEEIGSSMDIGSREQFLKMMDMLHRLDAIVVMDIDRLSRDRYESAKIMQRLKKHDVKIVTADGRITNLNNDQEEIMTGMQEVFANYEYNQIKKRLDRGKKASAEKGNWASGRTPLGYSYNRQTKKLEINEAEKIPVEKAFTMYAQGKSMYEITTDLNQQGYRTRNGKMFKVDGLGHILKNEVYIGNPIQRGVRYEGAAPAIVDEITFMTVQQRFINGAYRRGRATAQTHGLSALIRCGYCDQVHRIQVNKGGKNSPYKKPYKMLRGCFRPDVLTGELCKNKGMNYDKLMSEILKALEAQKREIVKGLEKLSSEASALQRTREDKLQQLLDNREKLCLQIERINDLILEAVFSTDEGLAMKEKKLAEIEAIDTEVARLKDMTAETDALIMQQYVETLEMFLDKRDEFTEREINDILTSVILNIKLYNLDGEEPRLEIEWR